MSIYITGDTHGANQIGFFSVDGYMNRLNSKHFPEGKNLTKDDYVIIVGDFGGIWNSDRYSFTESKSEKYELDWLDSKPWTTLFFGGNHENYDRLIGCKDETLLNSWLYNKMPDEEKEKLRQGYPQKKWHGGTVREIRPSILMLEDGIFTIDQEKFLIYNGADSHDINGGILYPPDFPNEKEFQKKYQEMYKQQITFRVEGISWWKAERTNPQREKNLRQILEQNHWSVDHVLTHTCPTSDSIYLGFTDKSDINNFLEDIEHDLKYDDWYFGHFHENMKIPYANRRLLYDNIVDLSNQQIYTFDIDKTNEPEF